MVSPHSMSYASIRSEVQWVSDAFSPGYSLHPPRSFVDAMLPEEKERKKKTAREWFSKPFSRIGNAVGAVFCSSKRKRTETSQTEAPFQGAPSADSSTPAVHNVPIPAQPPRFLQILEDSVASRVVPEVPAGDQPSQSPQVPLYHPSPRPLPQPFRPSASQGQPSRSSQVPIHHHHHQPQSLPQVTPSNAGVHPCDPQGASHRTPYSSAYLFF